MKIAFAVLLALHGLLHLIGPAKAFGSWDMTQLRLPISPIGGALWLLAAVLMVAAAITVLVGARWWWWLALPAVVLSQLLIMQAWSDARFGTLANLLIVGPVLLAALDARPGSFRSRFSRDSATLLARPVASAPVVTNADLAVLPPLLQRYLRNVGAVGRPHIHNMRVVFDAQMRSSAAAPWMASTATQYESFNPPARLFHMTASRSGVPFDVYHRYVDGAATFQVKVAGLYPMVNQGGPVMTRAETVTLMNDIVVMAPAAVLDLPFTYTTLGPHALRATFTNAGFTVAATLTFDDAGDLVGFLSTDRAQVDGATVTHVPWSTPISAYAEVDGHRVGTRGDANWIPSTGEWTYGRFLIRELGYNVTK
ncbi:MAG: hypothetical protein IT355_13485 [Gemmatimonadaceae bacterium]|nr:hypothetical protein [Gemmatimonadaceae bacterium]